MSTIDSSNATIADQSGSPDAFTPQSAARSTVSITAADCSRAFVGMHPRIRQVPPEAIVLLDERHAFAELRRAEGGRVAARSRADHDDVVRVSSCGEPV